MKLQLYINNVRVDLFKDEAITMTDTIQNIQDISKVFAPYTQTFTLPASDINNKLFKHYAKSQITDGYDARFRQPAIIKLNGVDFREGEIRLSSVKMEMNKAVSYRVTFFGSVVTMKELIGNDDLSSLNELTTYNTNYSSAEMARLFRYGIQTEGVDATTIDNRNVVLPFITMQNIFTYDSTNTTTAKNLHNCPFYIPLDQSYGLMGELKPAIKVRRIIEAIETQYDLEFNMADETIDGVTYQSFFGSDMFQELFLFCHRENTPSSAPSNDDDKTNSMGVNFTQRSCIWGLGDYTYVSGDGDFFSGDEVTLEQGEILDFRLRLTSTGYTNDLYDAQIIDIPTNELLWQQNDIINTNPSTIYSTEISSGTLSSRTFEPQIRTNSDTITNWNADAVGLFVTKTLVDGTILASTYSIGALTLGQNIIIQDYIPKIKVIDFFGQLLKMFNLVAYKLRNTATNKIYVETFDSFMSHGSSWDLSEYINISKSDVNRPIPFSAVNFDYADAVTQTSLRYIAQNSQQYGNLRYSAPDKFDGQAFDLKVDTQRELMYNIVDETKTPTGRVQGWWVDAKGETTKGNGYMFFNRNVDDATYPCTISSFDSINQPSNVSSDGNHTLNFGAEYDVYDREANINSLFSRFYSQYIVQTFEQRSRIIKVSGYLPMNFLLNYSVNDVITINNQEYYINSIKTNLLTRRCDLELITKFSDYTQSVLT